MFAFLAVMIVIGLLPVTIHAVFSVAPNRRVSMSFAVGPLTIRPRIGQGKAGLSWAKKILRKVKPPVPARRLISIAFQDVALTDFRVDMVIGLDDAAPTAITAGLVSGALTLAGMALKAANGASNSEDTLVRVRVIPDYGHVSFMMNAQTTLHSRFGRLVHLIVRLAALSLVAAVKAGMKKRPKVYKTGFVYPE